ncbi:MAG: hypothetical protein IT373_33695 [Polyangiaceae bacterium]|nr:hypothetical protein [Polyangiaceae bacterium]
MPSAAAAPKRTRVVPELVVHGAPIDFRELCRRTVPATTRTLLLDLDRTVHLGRNMGELLGWEICAHHGYGPERLAALEATRGPGRFVLDWKAPRALGDYLRRGTRMWAGPGLYYFFWGKLAWQSALLRRLSFRTLGPEPVLAAQRIPQTALMHHMAELPLGTLRELARAVWRRHAADQVILRDDLRWLRARAPGLRIVLTSASPQPVVEVAAAELDVDDIAYSTIEEHEGWLSAPAVRSAMFLPAAAPRRISPPARVRINASHAKIDTVRALLPEALAPGVETVGISDTGYGEDHCWAEHLGRVVDVNSTAPFPPVVGAGSPLGRIDSATLLTRAEHAARDAGTAWLDPRRHAPASHAPVMLRAATLEPALADVVAEIDLLLVRKDEAEASTAAARRASEAARAGLAARVAALVDSYNAAGELERARTLGELDALAPALARAEHEVARALRPVAAVEHALATARGRARRRVDRLVEAGREHAALAPGATPSAEPAPAV